MSDRSITLPATLINRLRTTAAGSPGVEICGLIGATTAGGYSVYPVTNIAAQSGIRFELHPREQIETMRRMRDREERLFAIYHSHPNGRAAPSPLDIDQAAYPEALQLIIGVMGSTETELRAYWIRAGEAEEVRIEAE